MNHFLDWLMWLPEAWEKQFQVELKAFEEARQMKYVTTWERMAEERGLISGERAILIRLLNRKFGFIDDRTLDQINTLSIDQLESLSENLLDFESIDDLTNWLERQD